MIMPHALKILVRILTIIGRALAILLIGGFFAICLFILALLIWHGVF